MDNCKIKAIIFDWGDTLMRDFTQYNGPMSTWPYVEIIHGVENALLQIYKNYICCVASNAGASDSKTMGDALERVGIKNFFSEFYTSQELGAKKPDIKFFQEILNRLNLKSDQVIMIGNDYIKDIIPAKAIGMGTILLSEIKDENPMPHADYTIASMQELPLTILNFK